MATPIPTSFGLTGDLLIDATTNGYVWLLGPDRTIDWSISNGFEGNSWNNPVTLQQEIGAALGLVSYYANVRFNYVGFYTTPAVASQAGSEINVAPSSSTALFPSSSIWAMGFFPNPSSGGIAGDVFLNVRSQANFLPSYAPGSAGWALFLHELGHALGLKHPHDDGGTGRPTFSQLGITGLDVDFASIMSYQDTFNWNLRTWDPATPMIMDVLALQFLYGKNMSTNAGDSVYALDVTNYYQTIWDAGGTDTVSVVASGQGWFVQLPNFQLSTLVDTKAGFAMPMSDLGGSSPHTLTWLAGDIENASGSNFADVLIGSSRDNFLAGNLGNDSIDGGGGIDIAFYSGLQAKFVVSLPASGRTVSGIEGTDSLVNVERLAFSDALVAIDLDGHAGSTVKLLGAVFGPNAIHNKDFVGIGLGLFDDGMSFEAIANIALGVALGTGRTNASVFNLLYTNLTGGAAPPDAAAYYIGLLNTGAISQTQLVTLAADHPLNLENIEFTGLHTSGIPYAFHA